MTEDLTKKDEKDETNLIFLRMIELLLRTFENDLLLPPNQNP